MWQWFWQWHVLSGWGLLSLIDVTQVTGYPGGYLVRSTRKQNYCLVAEMKNIVCWERKNIAPPRVSNGPPLSCWGHFCWVGLGGWVRKESVRECVCVCLCEWVMSEEGRLNYGEDELIAVNLVHPSLVSLPLLCIQQDCIVTVVLSFNASARQEDLCSGVREWDMRWPKQDPILLTVT